MTRDPAIMDPEVHAAILEVGGPPLLQEMLELFLHQLAHYSPLIEEALAQGDLPVLKAQLHAMKSAASSLGFLALEHCLHEFEKATLPPASAPELTEVAQSWRIQVQAAQEAAQTYFNTL